MTDTVYIKTELTAVEVISIFFKGIGYEVRIKEYTHKSQSIFYAETPEFVAYPEMLYEGYWNDQIQIEPTVRLRLDANKDVDGGYYLKILIQATLETIRTTGADMALEIENGNYVAMIYKSDRLLLNKNLSLWTSDRLSLVKMPYTLQEISA